MLLPDTGSETGLRHRAHFTGDKHRDGYEPKARFLEVDLGLPRLMHPLDPNRGGMKLGVIKCGKMQNGQAPEGSEHLQTLSSPGRHSPSCPSRLGEGASLTRGEEKHAQHASA